MGPSMDPWRSARLSLLRCRQCAAMDNRLSAIRKIVPKPTQLFFNLSRSWDTRRRAGILSCTFRCFKQPRLTIYKRGWYRFQREQRLTWIIQTCFCAQLVPVQRWNVRKQFLHNICKIDAETTAETVRNSKGMRGCFSIYCDRLN